MHYVMQWNATNHCCHNHQRCSRFRSNCDCRLRFDCSLRFDCTCHRRSCYAFEQTITTYWRGYAFSFDTYKRLVRKLRHCMMLNRSKSCLGVACTIYTTLANDTKHTLSQCLLNAHYCNGFLANIVRVSQLTCGRHGRRRHCKENKWN